MDSISEAKYNALLKTFTNPDANSHGTLKMLESIYPSFAKHLFDRNELMEHVVMSGLNPIPILDYFICGRCERLTAHDGYGKKYGKVVPKCTCRAEGCGHTTIDPPTFREWLTDEIRRKAPPSIVEELAYAVDAIALRLMGQAVNDYKRIANGVQESQSSELYVPSNVAPVSRKKITFDKIADDNQIADNNALWEKLNNKEKK